MECVICKDSGFSFRACDLLKPKSERLRRYGDCCSLSCAIKKQSNLEEAFPERFKDVIIKTPDGNEYVLKTYIGPRAE